MYQIDHQKNMCSAIFRDDNKIKKIHFGSRNSQTYLNHHDKLKRNNYLRRHEALGENWSEINAGSLSAFLLWGDSTDLKTNLYNYLNHFSILNYFGGQWISYKRIERLKNDEVLRNPINFRPQTRMCKCCLGRGTNLREGGESNIR